MSTQTAAHLAAYIGAFMRRFKPATEAGRKLAEWLRNNEAAFGITLPGEFDDVTWLAIAGQMVDLAADKASNVLVRNSVAFTAALDLGASDTAIFEFVLATDCDTGFEQLCTDLVSSRATDATGLISIAIDVSMADVLARLQGGPLRQLKLIDAAANGRERFSYLVPCQVSRALMPPNDGIDDIERALIGTPAEAHLSLAEYQHVSRECDFVMRLLAGALAQQEKGINILIHGVPGTGKTEFCKSVATALGCDLFAVGESDEDGDEPTRYDRLAALRLAERLTMRRGNALLLFDEMQDLQLGARAADRPSPVRAGSKVFFNRMLERNTVPVLWTTNCLDELDPAFLRRMAFVFELKPAPRDVRARVWLTEGRRHGLALDADLVAELAQEHQATPATIALTARTVSLAGGDKSEIDFAIRARDGNRHRPHSSHRIVRHDLQLLNADLDIARLTEQLAQGNGERAISLCLYGPSGTGKSAYAKCLAEHMQIDPLVKRGSDLLSMWVGGTEKRLADAFAEAKAEKCCLIFDEVDSLLWERSNSQHSWEASAVNELLQQMERHDLPFICTTNHLKIVDRAALRRFTFKIRFDYLTASQAARAYRLYFGCDAPASLAGMSHLTPADFALAAEKRAILGTDAGDAAAMLELLAREVEAKDLPARSIGFCR